MMRAILITLALGVGFSGAETCVECHKKVTPNIVSDWQASVHSKKGTECSTCHGEAHTSAHDAHPHARRL